MATATTTITTRLPPDFDLGKAVCSYGFYVLAPNRWDRDTQTFQRPLRDTRERMVNVTIRQSGDRLRARCDRKLSARDRDVVRAKVRRMLRLDESFDAWFPLHRVAKRAGFARIFRSPTLFEDIVKTMTCCNVTWPNTRRMNERLCEHHGQGGFPTPAMLACVEPGELKATCKVGYRAERIVRFARDVEQGLIDLDTFEYFEGSTDGLVKALRGIYGLGPYAAMNIAMLLGRYDLIPFDSEVYRHFREVHEVDAPANVAGAAQRELHDHIEAYYAKWEPYQFLAYWYELTRGHIVE